MRRLFGFLSGTALVGAGLACFAWWTARRVERAVPPTGVFMDVDGNRVHYLDYGSGPAVVLIHGLGGQMRNFPPELAGPLARDFRVIVLDRPGSGHSTRPLSAPAGLRPQAATIAAMMHRLGLERPLIVGHSLGGALALTLALEHPESTGGLALIAPLTQPQRTVPEPFEGLAVRSPLLRLLIAWTLAVPAAIRRGPTTLRLVFGPDPVPDQYGIKYGGQLSLRPKSYVNASADLVAAGDDLPKLASRYNAINVPVGILFGAADQILDPARHGAMAAAVIPGAELELVDGRGHMLPITAPERTLAFIRRIAMQIPVTRLE